MITTPSLRTGTDYIAFYAGGKVAQQNGFPNAYNIELQQAIQEKMLGFPLDSGQTLLYNHVPYLLPILSFLVSENYVASFARWVLLMLITYIAGIIIFIKNVKTDLNLMLLISALLFFPFFQSILLGQDTALLFLGVALWYVGMERESDWLAATGLALTTVRPHVCIALITPLLFSYRSIAWKFIILASSLTLFSMILIGKEGILDFVHILQISAGGTWYGMKEAAMINLIGMLTRMFPSAKAELIRAIGWVGYIIGILFAIVEWRQYKLKLASKISTAIILAVFFAPHLHYHDLTLLIIPLILLTLKNESIFLIPLGISLLLLLVPPLFYVIPYILYISLIWVFLKVEKIKDYHEFRNATSYKIHDR